MVRPQGSALRPAIVARCLIFKQQEKAASSGNCLVNACTTTYKMKQRSQSRTLSAHVRVRPVELTVSAMRGKDYSASARGLGDFREFQLSSGTAPTKNRNEVESGRSRSGYRDHGLNSVGKRIFTRLFEPLKSTRSRRGKGGNKAYRPADRSMKWV